MMEERSTRDIFAGIEMCLSTVDQVVLELEKNIFENEGTCFCSDLTQFQCLDLVVQVVGDLRSICKSSCVSVDDESKVVLDLDEVSKIDIVRRLFRDCSPMSNLVSGHVDLFES